MKHLLVGSVCVLSLLAVVPANATAQLLPFRRSTPAQTTYIPWEDLSDQATALTQQMLQHPTVMAYGPSETFPCSPEQYYWLLDHPDRVVTAWRRLGAKCLTITRKSPGRFGYADEHGTDLAWETIHQSPTMRIWYAEGKVKPTMTWNLVPVKALLILRHTEGKTPDGTTVMQHQAQIIVHTDSKAAAALTRLMGQSATKVAEQGLAQVQLFFSALSSYVDRHPDQVDALFRPDNTQAIQQTQKSGR